MAALFLKKHHSCGCKQHYFYECILNLQEKSVNLSQMAFVESESQWTRDPGLMLATSKLVKAAAY